MYSVYTVRSNVVKCREMCPTVSFLLCACTFLKKQNIKQACFFGFTIKTAICASEGVYGCSEEKSFVNKMQGWQRLLLLNKPQFTAAAFFMICS